MTEKTSKVVQTIEQSRMIGRKSSIRAFDPKSRSDMLRLLEIIQSSGVQKWMDGVEGMNYEDVKAWAKKRGKKWGRGHQSECMFAISGSPEYLEKRQVGKVQAFVNTYKVDKKDKESLIKKGIVKENEEIFEISYGKRPQAKPHQVAGGLIQVCFNLN